ncbi:MAG: efflux RND transporter periplasmic adaptor subunit [Vicinamibacterales bacterium]
MTRGDVIETVDATGTLEAVTTVQVGTQVSGTLKALHADFNSRVRRGQVIAELEPSLFETQVEQARASLTRLEADVRRAEVQLDDARQKLARARELAARELIAATELENAEVNARVADAALSGAQAQVVQARASLHQSEVNLGHTVITAPIDGIVISRNVDVGQTVAASMQAPTLFVIARDLREMQVASSIAESDVGRIQTGQPASFTVDAYPSRVFTGVVSQVRLQPVVEQNVVSYVTVIDVPNPDLRLKPGMTANVTVEIARAEAVLRVPNAALRIRPSDEVLATLGVPVARDGGATAAPGTRGHDTSARADGEVWVLTEGRLERVAVSVGISDGTRTAVVAPRLAEGAHVVTHISDDVSIAPTSGTSPLLPNFRGRGAGSPGAGAAPSGR